jgi:hypothetical protein
MLLFSQTTPLVADAFQTIVRAARASEALRLRLDQSVERILTAKDRIAPPGRFRPHLKTRIAKQIARLHPEPYPATTERERMALAKPWAG